MKPPRQLSRRESLSVRKAYLDFMADAHDKPHSNIVVPPKRQIRRPVDGQPVGPTEHQEQCALISWWSSAHNFYQLPKFALFAIPNGGARDMITGARLKAEGVRRGVVDLFLMAPTRDYHGLFLEMKVGTNKPSDEQNAFLAQANQSSYRAVVCWSADAAIAEIKSYLQGRP